MYSQHQNNAKIRLPITPTILLQLHRYWSPRATDHDIIMIWAACTTCFFGFFRAGEITLPNEKAFNTAHHLAWSDVTINDHKNPTILKVYLKKSKTDQLGKGVEVYMGKVTGPLCPISATTSYMVSRGSSNGPFFKFQNGQPLTKSKFTSYVREALAAVGLPCDKFAGHSFRIGAVTTAARAGVEDSKIRQLGQRNSSAYLGYV